MAAVMITSISVRTPVNLPTGEQFRQLVERSDPALIVAIIRGRGVEALVLHAKIEANVEACRPGSQLQYLLSCFLAR